MCPVGRHWRRVTDRLEVREAVSLWGRVSAVHCTTLPARLNLLQKESDIICMPVLCPRCHPDQVRKDGKTTVHI